MKRIMIISVYLLICMTGIAQNARVETIFREFKQMRHASYVVTPKHLLKSQFNESSRPQEIYMMNETDTVKELNLNQCSPRMRQDFVKATAHFEEDGYQVEVSEREGMDISQVLFYEKAGSITSILVLNIGKETCSLIQFLGKFSHRDLNYLIHDGY
ncbi:DUF4252 domain-containing protein [Segatella asaccharophila]